MNGAHCGFWGRTCQVLQPHQDEAPRSHSWAGLLPDKVTGSGTLTVGPSGMTLAYWPASGAAREIPIVNGAKEGSRWGSAPPRTLQSSVYDRNLTSGAARRPVCEGHPARPDGQVAATGNLIWKQPSQEWGSGSTNLVGLQHLPEALPRAAPGANQVLGLG